MADDVTRYKQSSIIQSLTILRIWTSRVACLCLTWFNHAKIDTLTLQLSPRSLCHFSHLPTYSFILTCLTLPTFLTFLTFNTSVPTATPRFVVHSADLSARRLSLPDNVSIQIYSYSIIPNRVLIGRKC